ncbi:Hypothetical protein SRAE_0000068000 [Strongyloides ratti]|uniref:Uncharacterized protein n=1 Tax=Strongyloides ratti TaxID=34506 RepID=A0A090KVM5_STRRB|nr:Hypothetical protein SRAE_0000068000 [Strongyloides ratti]CEF61560.1 Hypothetical protein SRAE_0000068000 [Strongyloides ratti]
MARQGNTGKQNKVVAKKQQQVSGTKTTKSKGGPVKTIKKVRSGSSQEGLKVVGAKVLYKLPQRFIYGPIVLGEKLETSTTQCRMELGMPTPDGKQVWKINKELFIEVAFKDNVAVLERYKQQSFSKISPATIKWLSGARKVTSNICARVNTVTDALETGILALKHGAEWSNEELTKLLISVKNDLSQVIVQNRRESILAKLDEMREEVLKREPQYMSDELADKMSNLVTRMEE